MYTKAADVVTIDKFVNPFDLPHLTLTTIGLKPEPIWDSDESEG